MSIEEFLNKQGSFMNKK